VDRLVIGCGYLGERVAVRWRQAGQRVFVTTRRAARADQLRALGFEPILCDVLDPESLRKLPRVDTVLHAVSLDRAAGVPMRDVYVDGLRNVLDALPRPGRFLHISSTSVYGQTDGEDVDETSPTAPIVESGQIVLVAERLLPEHCPTAIILRFAGIYGPNRLLRAAALRAGDAIVCDPDKWLNLIHVDDGVSAILAAEQRADPADPIYNVSDDAPVRRRDFYTLLAHLLNAPPPHFAPPPTDRPPPPHELAHRRVRSPRLHAALGMQLRYPSYRIGLPASLAPAAPRTTSSP
jgi:nucleoside-diphosphate-sugar epimerase